MLDLAGIENDSIVDGPGIRITIFCQGCPHHCPGCHNPETWEFGIGTPTKIEDIMNIIHSNPLCKGITLSGGEPFSQPADLALLARALKAENYEVASYSGYTFEQLLNGTPEQRELLETIDILIDGPFLISEKSLELNFRGSRNQRVLNVPKSLKAGYAIDETSARWLGQY